MKIAVGADHAGVALKDHLRARLVTAGHEVVDVGTRGTDSVDYPEPARQVARRVADGTVDRGVIVCGTGIGVAMTANKVAGVRAACCVLEFQARMARAHNDANVLTLGERVLGFGAAEALVDVFLATEFEGGRHARRVAKIEGDATDAHV